MPEKISGIITKDNGKIRKVDKWGKKRLAYEIQKKQYGFYVAIEFEGKGDIPKKLENDYNYNDKVLRYLTYRYDKHKIKLMEAEEKREEKTTGMENRKRPPLNKQRKVPQKQKRNLVLMKSNL
jgi:small subunit ribosomal protein S6